MLVDKGFLHEPEAGDAIDALAVSGLIETAIVQAAIAEAEEMLARQDDEPPRLTTGLTPTSTGTPLVTMSKTAERACARSTTSRSFSAGASPLTRKRDADALEAVAARRRRGRAQPRTSMSPSSVDSTSVSRTPRAAAT